MPHKKNSKKTNIIIDADADAIDKQIDNYYSNLSVDDKFYNFNESEKKKIEDDLDAFKQNGPDYITLNKDLQIYVVKDFIFGHVKLKKTKLHVNIVDIYFYLLQQKFTDNVYFTTWFLQEISSKKKKPEVINEPEVINAFDGAYDFKRFVGLFLKNKESIKTQMLDKMLMIMEEGKHKIFFPIFDDDYEHFMLAVVDSKFNSIIFFDSIDGNKTVFSERANYFCELIHSLMKDYYEYRKNKLSQLKKVETLLYEKMIYTQYEKTPQQEECWECGYYTCALGYLISSEKKIPKSYTGKQIQNIRLRIKESIINTTITPS